MDPLPPLPRRDPGGDAMTDDFLIVLVTLVIVGWVLDIWLT